MVYLLVVFQNKKYDKWKVKIVWHCDRDSCVIKVLNQYIFSQPPFSANNITLCITGIHSHCVNIEFIKCIREVCVIWIRKSRIAMLDSHSSLCVCWTGWSRVKSHSTSTHLAFGKRQTFGFAGSKHTLDVCMVFVNMSLFFLLYIQE